MRKKICRLVAMSFAYLFLTSGCGGGTSSTSSSANLPATTVMVYELGSDLESEKKCTGPDGGQIGCMTLNILQMMEVGSTPNMNVIVETGGAATPGWTTTKRWLVKKGQLLLLEDMGPVKMAESGAVTSFINYAVQNYPAQKYILVFGGHAGGVNGGYGGDENFKNSAGYSTYISVPNIVSAIKASQAQFSIVGFDACLMGAAEVTAALAPYTQYYIASEDLEPGAGWNFKSFLQYVTDYPNANGGEIGAEIVKGFIAANESNATTGSPEKPATLSVINTSSQLTNNLVTSINNFADALAPFITKTANWKAIAQARLSSFDFGTSVFFGAKRGSSDVVDLLNFAAKLQRTQPFKTDEKFIAASDAMIIALQQSISSNGTTELRSSATGLTIYYPSILAQYESAYYTTNTQNGPFYKSPYTTLVNNYWSYYEQESANLISQINSGLTKTNNVISGVANNDFAQAYALGGGESECQLSYDGEDGEESAELPCYTTLQAIYSVESTGAGYKLSFNTAGAESASWPRLTGINNESSNTIMIPDDSTDSISATDVEYYLIPVAKIVKDNNNETEEEGYIRVSHSKDVYTAVYFQSGVSSSTQSVEEIKSKTEDNDGDRFYLRRYALLNGNWSFLTDKSAKFEAPLSIQTDGVVPELSSFGFVIADLTGQTNVSESIAY